MPGSFYMGINYLNQYRTLLYPHLFPMASQQGPTQNPTYDHDSRNAPKANLLLPSRKTFATSLFFLKKKKKNQTVKNII